MSDEITQVISNIITSKEAKVILKWNDEEWYISEIEYSIGNEVKKAETEVVSEAAKTSSGGVKSPEWEPAYKYMQNDIVAWKGNLYYSKQNQNQGNDPKVGTFWWGTVVDLSHVDAITLEGKNLAEISRGVMGGNSIADYYKKTEVDNIILVYINNVNAKKLENWTLAEIQADYIAKVNAMGTASNKYTVDYLNDESAAGFDQSLLNLFNSTISNDNVNKF